MPAFQIIALDTTTPQLRAPGTGDTYSAPRAVAIAPESLTGTSATTSLDIAQTWNTTGTPTALKLNVTDTASNAASLLADLQVGGSSRFRVSKAGQANLPVSASSTAPGYTFDDYKAGIGYIGSTLRFVGGSNVLWANIGSEFIQVIGSSPQLYLGVDVVLNRDAANILAQRNGTNAQTLRVYETFTDASNYSRMNIIAGTNFDIQSQAAGTGTSRNIRIFTSGSNSVQFGTGGTIRWQVSTGGNFLADADNTYDIGASGANRPRDIWAARDVYAQSNAAGFYLGTSSDVAILRDDANILALRRSTNAQTFRIYNTYTDVSNYERMNIWWTANTAFIETLSAGTGTARNLSIGTNGASTRVTLFTAGTNRWRVDGNGHFTAEVDNTYDIGASGANRPRDIYLARNADVRGSFYIGGFGEFLGISAGVVCLRQFAVADFNRFQFGGTTSSFPALKRNGTALETKLADDTAFAPHAMQYLDVTDGVTAPGAAAGRARIYVDTADGDLKVVFADGIVKTIATDT